MDPEAVQAFRARCHTRPHAGLVRCFPGFVACDEDAPMKRVQLNLPSLKETKPHEYAVRFLFGGLCTVLAGLIAERFGPGIGGLFLAFPAIFPAGTSLIESHE